jgi:threonine synthase
MAEITYHSTRSGDSGSVKPITFAEAVINGLAPDGGLYVPSAFPRFDPALHKLSYQALAKRILSLYLTDFSEQEISACVDGAYDDKFRRPEIAPLSSFDGLHFIELYHGPTLAFKDMALSILPRFLKTAAAKRGIEDTIVILTATSGDTGKAALEGFAGVDGTRIVVFYPTDGVSEVQKRQMTTQEGGNTGVWGIRGNFDDAQNGVKAIFSDPQLRSELSRRGYRFSSANSINIGRLVPQIIYYFYGYQELLRRGVIKAGEAINIVVPTGNFGNILAAWYAGKMGLPVGRYICASNKNRVLTDFIRTGRYDLNRDFYPTISPSMDILISSNLERFLYELAGRDPELIQHLMAELKERGSYSITASMRRGMENFYGAYADDQATEEAIGELYRREGYLVDTHTAVGYRVLQDYRKERGDRRHALLASTASPFKFSRPVARALGLDTQGKDDFFLLGELAAATGIELPAPIRGLDKRTVLHPGICERDKMAEVVKETLG